MKKLFIIFACLIMIGCLNSQTVPVSQSPQQVEVKLRIEGVENVKVAPEGDTIIRSMEIESDDLKLSSFTRIKGKTAYIKLYSGITTSDELNVWYDLQYLKDKDVDTLCVYINSPGGNAFSGLGLADVLSSEEVREKYHIIGYAMGMVASAAVPVFAVCEERIASKCALFMVHETSLWKWPGRETRSDIKSQDKLMDLLSHKYLKILTDNSDLSLEEWTEMEGKTTWFTSEEAKEWGLVDKIE